MTASNTTRVWTTEDQKQWEAEEAAHVGHNAIVDHCRPCREIELHAQHTECTWACPYCEEDHDAQHTYGYEPYTDCNFCEDAWYRAQQRDQ
jgi:hypothetical protein